jgi:hypothetical protein
MFWLIIFVGGLVLTIFQSAIEKHNERVDRENGAR